MKKITFLTFVLLISGAVQSFNAYDNEMFVCFNTIPSPTMFSKNHYSIDDLKFIFQQTYESLCKKVQASHQPSDLASCFKFFIENCLINRGNAWLGFCCQISEDAVDPDYKKIRIIMTTTKTKDEFLSLHGVEKYLNKCDIHKGIHYIESLYLPSKL